MEIESKLLKKHLKSPSITNRYLIMKNSVDYENLIR